jgi:hypothetical protein
MNLQDLESIMEKYSIAIRRIPNFSVGVYEMRHYQDGDEIIKRNGKDYVRRTTVNKTGGDYLVVPMNTTSISPSWANSFRGKSIEEAVRKFLNSLS